MIVKEVEVGEMTSAQIMQTVMEVDHRNRVVAILIEAKGHMEEVSVCFTTYSWRI